MTRLRTKPSRSATATPWSKNASPPKSSAKSSAKKSAVGKSSKPGAVGTTKAAPAKKAIGAKKSAKQIYSFGDGVAEGNESLKPLLGGKGANLHGMTRMGLPVPPGFTITTDVCHLYYDHGRKLPPALEAEMRAAVTRLEKASRKKFGDPSNPLLVSVRSGARASMPGMMDTILNLGLNDQTVEGLAEISQNPRFAYDSYRRFISMYADVVLNVHSNHFEVVLEDLKHERGVESDTDLTADDLRLVVQKYKSIVRANGHQFPTEAWDQLRGAVEAVFASWMNPRAMTYRKLNDIPVAWGTAVNVQAMVFGNLGDDCATGVAFTRDPSTGEKKFFGEFLLNAQGEDVVAGIRTPQPVNEVSMQDGHRVEDTLERALPKAYADLVKVYKTLEKSYRDMQDIEFTIERAKLYMLQTRSGKRTAAAAIKIAVDMVREKLISEREAVMRVSTDQLDQLLHPRLDPKARKETIAKGLPASPGAATGQIVFDPDVAEKWVNDLGRKVILVRIETSPEDIHGMSVASGILTARGGMTSHAAVVARGMGKCCVSGCAAIKVNLEKKEFSVGDVVLKEGDWITLDGSAGEVIRGKVPTITAKLDGDFSQFMKWVDDHREIGVRTNADTPQDAKVARDFGAEGIGLCRTEHMFFEVDRIDAVREMILADTADARLRALEKILPMQRTDFLALFREMKGLPVTIRLLDPPLHEFIPQTDADLRELAEKIEVPYERLKRKAELLHEVNPMLGHRGCRLGVSYPEIYRTQVRAILEAACELTLNEGYSIVPEIMIPLVGDYRELKYVREYCEEEAAAVLAGYAKRTGSTPKLRYLIGTMIELPRAALTANEIAEYADFFSFGTNDLTQTTYGLSRDDSGLFLKDYLDAKIYAKDPFATLDAAGVGRLMQFAIREGRERRPDLKIGICGEHGGEPYSVRLCASYGLDYVSCSPYRVPIAKLAAAQAALGIGESEA